VISGFLETSIDLQIIFSMYHVTDIPLSEV